MTLRSKDEIGYYRKIMEEKGVINSVGDNDLIFCFHCRQYYETFNIYGKDPECPICGERLVEKRSLVDSIKMKIYKHKYQKEIEKSFEEFNNIIIEKSKIDSKMYIPYKTD